LALALALAIAVKAVRQVYVRSVVFVIFFPNPCRMMPPGH